MSVLVVSLLHQFDSVISLLYCFSGLPSAMSVFLAISLHCYLAAMVFFQQCLFFSAGGEWGGEGEEVKWGAVSFPF